MNRKLKVLSVFGTRPEAIKMCPLIKEMMMREEIDSYVCVTAQHRQMLDQVLEIFHVEPDYDLNLMKEDQTLTNITTGVLIEMEQILKELHPDLVLVHGDTTTAFAAALASFYQKIPVGHVEAGLRTYKRYSPFPEEMNRRLLSGLTTLHFAPTSWNVANLEKEGITQHLYITGNTVIDAFKTTIQKEYSFHETRLNSLDYKQHKIILVTAHRRENLGPSLENICKAILRVTKERPEVEFIYPVHLNPLVRSVVYALLDQQERIHLLNPLDVQDMHNLMSKSYLIITDSGGIQEEAPSLNIPVIVARKETERQEAIEAGTIVLGGVEEKTIYDKVIELLDSTSKYEAMAFSKNPYGDGDASALIVEELLRWRDSL